MTFALWEVPRLKRTPLYAIAAIIVGLTLIFVPLFAVAEIHRQDSIGVIQTLPNAFRQVEGGNYDIPMISQADVETLSACFAIALVGYVFFRRSSRREHVFSMTYPY